MRRHGKTAVLVTCFAVVSLFFVCGHSEANFAINTPPLPMVDLTGDGAGDPVLGVRITEFNPLSNSNDLIVGVPPLGDPDNLNKGTLNTGKDWSFGAGCNRVIVTLSPDSTGGNSSYELKLTIGTWPGDYADPPNPWSRNDCDTILPGDPDLAWHSVIHVVDSSSLPPEKWAAFQAGLNILQVNIANTSSGSNIQLVDLWKGADFSLGNFNSMGQDSKSWSLIPDDQVKFLSPFSTSFAASLVLDGSFSSDSYVELLFGKYTPPNQPPDCVNVVPSTSTLWPANGEFWEIGLTVPDPDLNDIVTVEVTGIRQDEPVCGSVGPGPCQPDATIVNGLAKLRAERNPAGNGRVYTVDFTADDGNQGTCSGQVVVGVPKNKGKHGVPVDDGPLYSSTSP